MKKISLAAALLLFSSMTPALAQNQAALCKLRATYKSDGSADYKAGVDAQGNAVAPADVAPTPHVTGSTIRIPLSKVLAGQLGLDAKANVGMVEIHGDGSVSLNGQDLTQKADELCAAKPVEAAAEKKPEEKPVENKADAAATSAPAAITAQTSPEAAPVVEGGNVSMPADASAAATPAAPEAVPAAPAAPEAAAPVVPTPVPAAPNPPPAADAAGVAPSAPPAADSSVPAVPAAPNGFDDPAAVAPAVPAPQGQIVPVSPPADAGAVPPAPPAVEPQAGDEAPKAEKIIWRRPQ